MWDDRGPSDKEVARSRTPALQKKRPDAPKVLLSQRIRLKPLCESDAYFLSLLKLLFGSILHAKGGMEMRSSFDKRIKADTAANALLLGLAFAALATGWFLAGQPPSDSQKLRVSSRTAHGSNFNHPVRGVP